VLIEALREQVAKEDPFPYTGSLAEDIRQQLLRFSALLAGRRGRTFTAFIAAAQSDPEIADAFRQMWIAPRRAEAKRVLERYRRTGEIHEDTDLDLAIEMMYAPLYYRLLTGYGRISKQYVETLARTVLEGLQKQAAVR
jgi:hypothetical protein